MTHEYDPYEVFGVKLEQDEEILHSGLAHVASGCLMGCAVMFFLPVPAFFLIFSLLAGEYIAAAVAAGIIIAVLIAFFVIKLSSQSLAPTVITSKRILSKLGKDFQSVYYDDIHEIHFDRKTGAITVVAFSTARLVMCSKMTRNKGRHDFNPSPYLHLLFSFTENQEEAYRILNETAAPFIYKEK